MEGASKRKDKKSTSEQVLFAACDGA